MTANDDPSQTPRPDSPHPKGSYRPDFNVEPENPGHVGYTPTHSDDPHMPPPEEPSLLKNKRAVYPAIAGLILVLAILALPLFL